MKSRVGLTPQEITHDIEFCTQTILQSDLLIVPDALADSRFAENSLVTSEPQIRFYAGAPLWIPEGYCLGTLCVMDREPRALTVAQQEALRDLSRQVIIFTGVSM